MLCDAMCDAGGPNQLSESIENLGLWTRLGIPTRATHLETHHLVRFYYSAKPIDFKYDFSFSNTVIHEELSVAGIYLSVETFISPKESTTDTRHPWT